MISVATMQLCQNKHWVKTNRSPLDQLSTLKKTVVGPIFPEGQALLDPMNFLDFIHEVVDNKVSIKACPDVIGAM